MKDFLIIAPFNGVFFAFLALNIALALLALKLLKNKPTDTKRRFLTRLYIFVFLVFVAYKLLLPLDAEYMQIYKDTWGSFTYLNELPLNPCNVTLLVLPFAMRSMKRPLLCFCFFAGILGPIMALVMPITGFSGYSLWSIHVFGYYFTHFAILMAPILLLGFGLYAPRCRDTFSFAVIMILLAAAAYGVDVLLRKTGLVPSANYFFCIDHENNPVLMLFHRLIPLPYFCVMPGLAILIPACLGITGVYNLCKRVFSGKAQRSAALR